MLAGKKLADYTSLLSPHDFKKNDHIISMINKSNSIKAIDKTNLTNQTKFRSDKISKIENILLRRLIKENHAVKN